MRVKGSGGDRADRVGRKAKSVGRAHQISGRQRRRVLESEGAVIEGGWEGPEAGIGCRIAELAGQRGSLKALDPRNAYGEYCGFFTRRAQRMG